MKDFVLLNYTGDDNNWGCKTTSEELVRLLSMNGDRVKTIPISFSSSFKARLSGHFKLWFIFFKLFHLFKPFRFFFRIYFNNFSWNKKFYREIQRCDHLILNGEGTIHVFNRAVAKWMFYILVGKLVFLKKVSVVNHTFQVDNDKVISLTEYAYSICDYLYVREPMSKDVITSRLGVEKEKISIVADAAFMKSGTSKTLNINSLVDGRFFCICGNVVTNEEQFSSLCELINKIKLNLNLQPIFLIADNKDLLIYHKMLNVFPDMPVIENEKSVDDVFQIINECDFFITGRFHPFIFALSLGKLTFTYRSNTFKIEGVKKMTSYLIPDLYLITSNDEENWNLVCSSLAKVKDGSLSVSIDVFKIREHIRKSYNQLIGC